MFAKVYVELTGGLQTFLFDNQCEQDNNFTFIQHKVRNLAHREHSPSNEEINEHRKLLDTINNPLWENVSDIQICQRPEIHMINKCSTNSGHL